MPRRARSSFLLVVAMLYAPVVHAMPTLLDPPKPAASELNAAQRQVVIDRDKARRLRTAGISLTAVGAGTAVVGAVLTGAGPHEGAGAAGIALMVPAAPAVLTGAGIWAFADIRYRRLSLLARQDTMAPEDLERALLRLHRRSRDAGFGVFAVGLATLGGGIAMTVFKERIFGPDSTAALGVTGSVFALSGAAMTITPALWSASYQGNPPAISGWVVPTEDGAAIGIGGAW